jgi:hypothetical protein
VLNIILCLSGGALGLAAAANAPRARARHNQNARLKDAHPHNERARLALSHSFHAFSGQQTARGAFLRPSEFWSNPKLKKSRSPSSLNTKKGQIGRARRGQGHIN